MPALDRRAVPGGSVTFGAAHVSLDAACQPGGLSPARATLSLCTSVSLGPLCACSPRGPSPGGSLGWAAARP